jgi:ribosome biogenesis GTPase / thiamine phosphate phosphatase
MTLKLVGWNKRWQKEFAALDAADLVPGRVIGEHRSHFQVAVETAEVSASTTGRMRNAANMRSDLPGVGDFVALRLAGGTDRR